MNGFERRNPGNSATDGIELRMFMLPRLAGAAPYQAGRVYNPAELLTNPARVPGAATFNAPESREP